MVHFYCWFYNKKVPYLFFDSNIFQDIFVRILLPLVVIFFAVDSSGDYYLNVYLPIVCLVCFFVLQRIYQKGFNSSPYGGLRHPEIVIKNLKIPLTRTDSETKLHYNEYAIFILSFFLPFQEYIPFDIQRISVFLFSFNCFVIFLIIPSTKEIVGRIFR